MGSGSPGRFVLADVRSELIDKELETVQEILMAKGAAKLVDECLAVQRNDRVAIVTDTARINIANILAIVLEERRCDFSIHVMRPRRHHAEEPPASIAAAMREADAILMPTTYSLTHTAARRSANVKGARILSLPGYTNEMLLRGGLDADFRAISQDVAKAAIVLERGKTARVTSSLGTDLTIDIRGKHSISATGIADQPGTWAAPPAIETAIAPVEDTAHGSAVVDGVLIPGGLVREPITIRFDRGRVVQVSGGEQAREFERLLAQYNDPNVYCLVELGIGFNPCAQLGRNYLEDETTYGTLHLGLGEGRSFGSSISASAHLDVVLDCATLSVDSAVIVRNREIFLQ